MELASALVEALKAEGPLTFDDLRNGLPAELREIEPGWVRAVLRDSQEFRRVGSQTWALAGQSTAGAPANPPRERRRIRVRKPAQWEPPSSPTRPFVSKIETGAIFIPARAIDLEHEYRDSLRKVSLVAEIGFDREMHEQICSTMCEALAESGDLEHTIDRLPALHVCHLVGHGIIDYRKGDYWTAPEGEGFERSASGQPFLNGLRRFELARFPGKTRKYVDPILLHGGIPEYCTGDFRRLLTTGVARHGSSGVELRAAWSRLRSTFVNIDRPVQHFIEHGGDFAIDVLDRCIDLVIDGASEESSSSGLPPYLVQAFQGAAAEVRRGVGQRLAKPTIRLDRWTFDGPALHIPAINRSDATHWLLKDRSGERRLPLSAVQDLVEGIRPSTFWTVTLMGRDGPLTERTFAGFAASAPGKMVPAALFFDADSGELLPNQDRLVGTSLLAVFPVAADSSATHRYSDLSGDWSGFATAEFAECGASVMVADHEWPVAESTRPRLVGQAASGLAGRDGRPVFSVMPRLQLPAAEADEERFVRIKDSEQTLEYDISSLPLDEAGLVVLPLVGHPAELAIRVRGRLGRDLRQSIIVIPGLVASVSDRIALPGKPASVGLVADDGITFDGQANLDLSIDAGERRTSEIVRVAGAAGNPPLELVVAAPRLSWSWVGLGRGSETESLPVNSILDGTISGLRGSVGRPDVVLRLVLRLDGKTSQEVTTTSGKAGTFAIGLGRLADTLRQADTTELDLVLHVGLEPITIARLRPDYEVSKLLVTSAVKLGRVAVELGFSQSRDLDGRLARFWPSHRPWEGPVERVLEGSDSTLASFEFTAEEMPVGYYFVEVGLASWSMPQRPAPGPSVCEVIIGTPDSMHSRLTAADRSIEDLAEHLLLSGSHHRNLVGKELDEFSRFGAHVLVELLGRPETRRLSETLLAVSSWLGARPAATLRGLLEMAEDDLLSQSEAARIQVALLGLLQPDPDLSLSEREMEAAWLRFPTLALSLDEGLRSEGAVSASAIEQTGLPETGVPVGLARIENFWLALTAAQLSAISLESGLRGEPPVCSPDGLQLTHFEWIQAGAIGAVDLEEWWNRYRRSTQAVEMCAAQAAQVDGRRPQNAVSHASIPVLSLIAAFGAISSPSWTPCRELLADLAEFAPRLVVHDLVIALLDRFSIPIVEVPES